MSRRGPIKHLIMDLVTGPDGETYAIGRILGLILFFFGLAMPTGMAIHMMMTQTPPLSEWVSFISSLAVYIPALMGGVVLLIAGSNFTEPMDPEKVRALIPQNQANSTGWGPTYSSYGTPVVTTPEASPAPRLDLPS